MAPAEETVIEIHEHLRADVLRIEHIRQYLMAQLNERGQELRQLLKIGHGIDVAEPGWRLDAEGGKLAYVPEPVPTPAGLHVVQPEANEEQ